MKTDEGLFEDWYQRAFTLEEKMTNPALRTENRLPYFAGLAEGREEKDCTKCLSAISETNKMCA